MNLPFKLVVLWTDVVLWGMLVGLLAYVRVVRRDETLQATWRRVFVVPAAMAAAAVLTTMLVITLFDSIHFRRALPDVRGGVQAYDTRTDSLLDVALAKLVASREDSYSRPWATHGFSKQTVPPSPGAVPELDEHGVPKLPPRAYPRLKHGGAGLADPSQDWSTDIACRVGACGGTGSAIAIPVAAIKMRHHQRWQVINRHHIKRRVVRDAHRWLLPVGHPVIDLHRREVGGRVAGNVANHGKSALGGHG